MKRQSEKRTGGALRIPEGIQMTRSFEDAGKIGKEFLDTGLEALNAVSRDAQAIGAETADYATKLIETSGEAFGRLMSAKSIEKVAQIQSAYLKQAYEGFVAEATKLGGLYADMAKDACQPFEAIAVRTK